MLLSGRSWETSNPVAAGDAADPYLVPNLNGDGAKYQEVIRRVADYFIGREALQKNLRDPRRHPVALPLPDAFPDRRPRWPDMTGGKQRLAGAPPDVVDMKPDLHGVCLDRCPST